MTEATPQDERILEIYRMSVEMADRISARRASANSYFITVQGGLITALGFLASRNPPVMDRYLVAIATVGVIASIAWFLLLRSYRDLNRAKFQVILEIEKELPLQPYATEWVYLKRDPIPKWRPRYAELGTIERMVPALFGIINFVLALSLGCRQ